MFFSATDALPARDLALDALAHRLGSGRRGQAAEIGEALPDVVLGEDSRRSSRLRPR